MPASSAAVDGPEAPPAAPGGEFGLWAGMAAGFLAVGVAAFLFWPRGSEAPVAALAPPPAAPAPEAAPEVAAPPVAEAPRPLADPALASVTVVRLRIGPDLPPQRQTEILAALTEAGLQTIVVEPLPFEIATSRVGYYREEDLPAAEALGRVVTPVIAHDGAVGVRDYGALLADAQPGRLDLWIGS